MDSNAVSNSQCGVCLNPTQPNKSVQLPCKHIFCNSCIIKYIETLRSYSQLRPQKLCCFEQGCGEQIPDQTITKLFPGQTGFIFNMIRKRYKQSKDPNVIIFDCKGFITLDRKMVIPKPNQKSREQHSLIINAATLKLIRGEEEKKGLKGCPSILSINKGTPHKQKMVLCYGCGCSYCISCSGLMHQGNCVQITAEDKAIIDSKNQQLANLSGDELQNFIEKNGILRCLNPKCRVAIAKQQGCFWIKCRCSWEMCYPCKKLWGDCEHFSKYPYKKFVPPPQWMVKALNMF